MSVLDTSFNRGRASPSGTVYVRGQPKELKNPYTQMFLHPKKQNPSQFLREISFQIDLGLLYEMRSTTFYHARMPYVGIVLKIKDPIICDVYKGNYLLQVWKKGGEKVYERVMQHEVTVWNCYGDTLIYQSPRGDDHDDCLTIVNLTSNTVRQIQNFSVGMEKKHMPFKYVFYGNQELWVGSKNLIIVAKIPENQGEEITQIKREKVCVYDPAARIWGFYPGEASLKNGKFDVIFETDDHQLDFSEIESRDLQPENFIPTVKQKRDIIPRQGYGEFDVQEVAVLYTWENVCFSMSLLAEGRADFYWDQSRLCSNNSRNLIEEICFSERHFFYKRRQETTFQFLDLSLGSQINLDLPGECEPEFTKKVAMFSNVKNYFNIFQQFSLIKNTCYVAHGKILSQYNTIENAWTAHLLFDQNVKFLFKYNNKGNYEPCLVLEDGQVHNNVLAPKNIMRNVVDLRKQLPDVTIFDKIIKIYPDQEDAEKVFYMTEKPDGSFAVKILKGTGITEIQGIENCMKDATLVVSFSEADNTQFLYKHFDKLVLYELQAFKEGDEFTKVKEVQKIHAYEIAQIMTLNSAFSNDCKERICMADEKNFYIWEVKNKKIKTLYDHNVKGIYFFDEAFVYTLSLPSRERQGGLRLYEANGLLQGQEDSYLLTPAAIGCSQQIDYNRGNVRLAFQKSAEQLEIVPLLHRNTINFLGMPSKNNILATRTYCDKFTILTNEKDLITWDVCTGKMLFTKKSEVDVDGYQVAKFAKQPDIYSSHHYEAVLLRHNEKLQDVNTEEFFKDYLKLSTAKFQQSFIECTEKDFHYFQLVKIVHEKEVKILRKFIHPQYKTYQRIYFSEDYNLMFEELENKIVILYEWYPEGESLNEGKWVIVKRLHKYPDQLEPKTPFLTLNSPNFKKYIEFDETLDRWVIRSTSTQELLYQIPKNALFKNGKEDAALMIRRFKWVDNRYFKYLTPGCIERLIDTEDGFKEVNYNVIQDVNTADMEIKHFYDSYEYMEENDVLKRLSRIQNLYKSAYWLEGKRQIAPKKATQKTPKIIGENGLYPIMFSVDMGNLKDGFQTKFRAVHSFTFLDWKIIEEIENGVRRAEDIDIPQLERISKNILPSGITILHILADNPESLNRIFELSQPNPEDKEEFEFEIPYVMNFHNEGFLDICFNRKDMKTINMSLEFLQGYGLDHHSRAINTLLPHFTDLPNFVNYIDSRLQKTNVTAGIKRGAISEETKGLSVSYLQIDKDLLTNKIFNRRAKIEQEVTVEILDVPKVHDYQEPLSDQMFKTISKTQGFDIFASVAIQKLILFKYRLVRQYTMSRLFIPFAVFQFTFFFYTSQIKMEYLNNPTNYPLYFANYASQFILFFLALYFLQNQSDLVRTRGSKHFSDIWNIIDIINPTLVLMMLVNYYIDDDRLQVNTWETIMSAFSTFTMWAKQLYFLRVFDAYSYLIRMINQVIIDMKEFLVVLMLAIVAFSDTYRTISDGNDEDNRFVDGTADSFLMAYKMALGDFDTDNFGKVAVPMCIFFFFLCTVFNMIVMFNLLIAIISETFTNVNENAEYAGFQEKANMVAENAYLVPYKVKAVQCEDNQFLVIAREKDEDSAEHKNPVLGKVDKLMGSLKENMDDVKQILAQQDETIEAIFKHHGLKRKEPEKEEQDSKGSAMGSTMGKGLANAFGLGGLKGNKKSSQRLIMGMSVGAFSQDGERKPNIDPHKILGEVLSIGMARKKKAREEGRVLEDDGFVSQDMIKKRQEQMRQTSIHIPSGEQKQEEKKSIDVSDLARSTSSFKKSEGNYSSIVEAPVHKEEDEKAPADPFAQLRALKQVQEQAAKKQGEKEDDVYASKDSSPDQAQRQEKKQEVRKIESANLSPEKVMSQTESLASKMSLEEENAAERLRSAQKQAFEAGTVEETVEASRIEENKIEETQEEEEQDTPLHTEEKEEKEEEEKQ